MKIWSGRCKTKPVRPKTAEENPNFQHILQIIVSIELPHNKRKQFVLINVHFMALDIGEAFLSARLEWFSMTSAWRVVSVNSKRFVCVCGDLSSLKCDISAGYHTLRWGAIDSPEFFSFFCASIRTHERSSCFFCCFRTHSSMNGTINFISNP